MKKGVIISVLILLTAHMTWAQADPWADAVVLFEAGSGAGFGQEYFPDNILGPPDSTATAIIPSSSPEELLSLGFAGVIILEFADNLIVDGNGADFTVFENPFYIGGNPEIPFIEAGIVSASSDGITWYEFPYDTSTYEGLAGVTPTNGDQDPTDPSVSGGDSFDLSEIGLSETRFIRIEDAGERVPDMGPSFDLDAVVAVNSVPVSSVLFGQKASPEISGLQVYPNPGNPFSEILLTMEKPQYVQLKLYDELGRLSRVPFQGFLNAGQYHFALLNETLTSGCYWLIAATEDNSLPPVKIVILK